MCLLRPNFIITRKGWIEESWAEISEEVFDWKPFPECPFLADFELRHFASGFGLFTGGETVYSSGP